jgi:hypothetical protein
MHGNATTSFNYMNHFRNHCIFCSICFLSELLMDLATSSMLNFYRFTFKVVVEKKEAPDVVLECFGAPQSKKKDAEEHAAEGALWYLKHDGYLLESD